MGVSMKSIRRRLPLVLLALVGLTLSRAPVAAAQSLPSPEQYLGFRVGADKKLATWPQVVAYMRLAAKDTKRVRTSELGKTTMGNPFLLVAISSPKNLGRLPEIRANQRKLAYPYELDERAANAIVAKNPAVVLIGCTIHSSELASTQMALELVYRLATDRSPATEHILDNVVLLLVPSLNPDGQVLVVNWYKKNVNTPYEYSPMPWLYNKYTGHDDNRDGFMLTQVETRLITKLLYKDWLPLSFLDEHQMGQTGARIAVPPETDPINPNQDPLVLAEASLIGMRMFTALQAAGKPGAIYSSGFTWYYQGTPKNGTWWHNMASLLVETASASLASPTQQLPAPLYHWPSSGQRYYRGSGDPSLPLPPPADTWPRTNYPDPWQGGAWRLRDIVDYEEIITYAYLNTFADNREMFQRHFYELNRKYIAIGHSGDPFAYVIPAGQRDPGAVWKLLDVLDRAGIEVDRANTDFRAGGKQYHKGDWLVRMAQPFQRYAKDLLEPQRYPMKPVAPGEAPERPYDVTGWTLPLQMGVKADVIEKPFTVSINPVSPVPMPAGGLLIPETGRRGRNARRGLAYVISHTQDSSATAVNRLLAADADADVYWSEGEFHAGGVTYPPGTIVIRPRGKKDIADFLDNIGRQTHVAIHAVPEAATAGPAWKLRPPRIAIYQPWTADSDEGWTRWLMDQYGFPYTILHNEDVRAGHLAARFDAVILASQSERSILDGRNGNWIRPEYRGGLGSEGAKALDNFVREGGTLVALDAASDFAIDQLGLPVRDVLRNVPHDKFYCPGAILSILVDSRHPIGYGMAGKTSAYFLNSPAFELLPGFTSSRPRAVVRYPSTNPLASGWIGGAPYIEDRVAAAEVAHGKGRVVLLGFRAQFRGQPHATFLLLFNALQWSASEHATLP
jgi:hypothetical protein